MRSTIPTDARRKKPRHRSGPPAGPEVRFMVSNLEVRSASDGSDTIEILGEPIVYDTPYKVRDLFGEFEETMVGGAAAAVLPTADVRFLFNHDGLPLARTTSGTLTLEETDACVRSIARLDARQQLANDLAVAIERQDVSQMSCAFNVKDDSWSADYREREITELRELLDVSAVTYPASPTTSISVAQRMMLTTPLESRARIRKAWLLVRELREGKVLSSANAQLLAEALDALHTADDVDIPAIVRQLENIDQAIDTGQEAIATVLDKTQPVVDPDDQEPALERATRGIPATADERREASLSFGDQRTLVYQALVAHLGDDAEDDDGYVDIWICDLGADWVVWESYCDSGPGPGTWRLAYTLEDQVLTFSGEPEQVTTVTSYVPVEIESDDDGASEDDAAAERSAPAAISRALELDLELLASRRSPLGRS